MKSFILKKTFRVEKNGLWIRKREKNAVEINLIIINGI
jgi:hypothetical protein